MKICHDVEMTLSPTRLEIIVTKSAISGPLGFGHQTTPIGSDIKSKMADQQDVFRNSVFGALIVAETELKKKGIDAAKVKKAIDDLVGVLGTISKRHFDETQSRHRHIIGNYFPMLQRKAERWYSRLMRRMSLRCSVARPWRIVLEELLPKELFSVIEDIVSNSRSSYGVVVEETKRTTAMVFTSHVRVRRLIMDLLAKSIASDDFLKKTVKKKKVQAIINDEKQFCLKYNKNKEEICFELHYGAWNEFGWPQHI